MAPKARQIAANPNDAAIYIEQLVRENKDLRAALKDAVPILDTAYYTSRTQFGGATMNSAGKWVPGRLWSLWDIIMIDLNTGQFQLAIGTVQSFSQLLRDAKSPLNTVELYPRNFQDLNEQIDFLSKSAALLGMPGQKAAADDLINALKQVPFHDGQYHFGPVEFSRLIQVMDTLVSGLLFELRGRTCLFLSASDTNYFSCKEPLFGSQVFDNFSSANEDIAEAAKCLAVSRGTACVMHLQRALEVALKALGKALDVLPQQNDWGSWIREIKDELEKRYKTSGSRTPEEQFYAEAVAEFEALKRAWRNPSMHVDRNYSPDRAGEIFNAVRSFMRHLAIRLSE